jgi:hypothetical protein
MSGPEGGLVSGIFEEQFLELREYVLRRVFEIGTEVIRNSLFADGCCHTQMTYGHTEIVFVNVFHTD